MLVASLDLLEEEWKSNKSTSWLQFVFLSYLKQLRLFWWNIALFCANVVIVHAFLLRLGWKWNISRKIGLNFIKRLAADTVLSGYIPLMIYDWSYFKSATVKVSKCISIINIKLEWFINHIKLGNSDGSSYLCGSFTAIKNGTLVPKWSHLLKVNLAQFFNCIINQPLFIIQFLLSVHIQWT